MCARARACVRTSARVVVVVVVIVKYNVKNQKSRSVTE